MFAPLGWLKGPGARRVYRSIQASGQFDASWYRKKYLRGIPWMDPLWHYLDQGWQQGFDPSPYFDTSHYVESSSDVQSSGANPLFHYIEYGHEERRAPVRSPLQTLHYFLPQAAPLQMFLTPSAQTDRVTVVVDENTFAGTTGTASAFWATVLSSPLLTTSNLRVLSRIDDFAAVSTSIEAVRQLLSFPSHRIDLVDARGGGLRKSYPMSPGEQFMASSWTSCLAISQLAGPKNLWEIRETGGTFAITSLNAAGAHAHIPSPPDNPLPVEGPLSISAPSLPESSSPVRALVIADPEYQLAYCQTMRALEDLLFAEVTWEEMLNVEVRGQGVHPISLAEKPLLVSEARDQAYDVVINVSPRAISHPRVVNVIDLEGTPLHDVAPLIREQLSAVLTPSGVAT